MIDFDLLIGDGRTIVLFALDQLKQLKLELSDHLYHSPSRITPPTDRLMGIMQ
jgi:hypothetical protein